MGKDNIKFRNEDCPLSSDCEHLIAGECKDNHKECSHYVRNASQNISEHPKIPTNTKEFFDKESLE